MSDGDDTPFGYEPGPDSDDDARGMIREEGVAGKTPFDPSPYMRQLRGRGGNQDYLDVKWRLLWLRREHPDAEILTEHVRIDEGMAIFKATVSVPTGGKATGYGSETAGDFGDFIEKAETKAIGRALNALGYGAQFSEKGEEEASPPPATPRHQSRTAAPDRPISTRTEAPPRPSAPLARNAPVPAPETSTVAPDVDPGAESYASRPRPAAPAGDEPVPIRPTAQSSTDRSPRREPPESRPAPAPSTRVPTAAPATTLDNDDDELADMTWTAFWAWARPLGYNKRGDIEQFLGHSIDALTPAEVRTQVRTARGEA